MVSQGEEVRDSNIPNFVDAVVAAQSRRIVRIDIATTWWSTRLYLLAYLVERLTEIRRIAFPFTQLRACPQMEAMIPA
ncbi:MAG: hypothetical protein PVH87_01145 [Desulfobacteraceae bacterium]|jgi:hypothetical protein